MDGVTYPVTLIHAVSPMQTFCALVKLATANSIYITTTDYFYNVEYLHHTKCVCLVACAGLRIAPAWDRARYQSSGVCEQRQRCSGSTSSRGCNRGRGGASDAGCRRQGPCRGRCSRHSRHGPQAGKDCTDSRPSVRLIQSAGLLCALELR